jgi:hypothetical protein
MIPAYLTPEAIPFAPLPGERHNGFTFEEWMASASDGDGVSGQFGMVNLLAAWRVGDPADRYT